MGHVQTDSLQLGPCYSCRQRGRPERSGWRSCRHRTWARVAVTDGVGAGGKIHEIPPADTYRPRIVAADEPGGAGQHDTHDERRFSRRQAPRRFTARLDCDDDLLFAARPWRISLGSDG